MTTLLVKAWVVEASWNVMAHALKPDFVFWRNGRVDLNRRGRQFSRLLAPEVCASAVVMLNTPCSEVVWRVLAAHSIRQVPLHFPSRASPCAITFQLESTVEEFSCFFGYRRIRHRVHGTQPLDSSSSRSYLNPIHMFTPCLLRTHFSVFLPTQA